MGRRRRLLPALAAALLAVATGACRSQKSVQQSGNPAMPMPELRMQALTVQSWGETGLEWELRAPVGEGFTRRNFIQVSSMNVQLFENGERSSQISANRAVMATSDPSRRDAPIEPMQGVLLSSGDMFMDGRVVVVSTDGSKLETDWIRYSGRDELIRSSAPVVIERPDSITRGRGLEATSDLQKVKIFNQTLVIPDQKDKK